MALLRNINQDATFQDPATYDFTQPVNTAAGGQVNYNNPEVPQPGPTGAPNGALWGGPGSPGSTQNPDGTWTAPKVAGPPLPAGFHDPNLVSSFGGDYQKWFQGMVGSQPSSYDLIKQLEPQLNSQGVKVNYNLEGDPSKLVLPNGHFVSVVDRDGKWRWMDQGTAADNAAPQQQAYQPPALSAPGPTPGIDPNFSSQLQGGYDTLFAKLGDIIKGNGALPGDDQNLSRNVEANLAPLQRLRQTDTQNLRARLAEQGLLGSGEDTNAQSRLAADEAPAFTGAVNSAYSNDAQLKNQRLSQSLSDLIQGVNSGNSRQGMLAQAALGNLDQNRTWNQFLASFGLQREEVANMISQGQIGNLLQLFNIFNGQQSNANQGYF